MFVGSWISFNCSIPFLTDIWQIACSSIQTVTKRMVNNVKLPNPAMGNTILFQMKIVSKIRNLMEK